MDLIKGSDLQMRRRPPKRRDAPIRYVDHCVTVCGEALDATWWTGRQWAVTAYGIEALDGTYAIERKRLFENLSVHSWLEQMSDKAWVDTDDFATAWLVAIALHGERGEALRTAIRRSPVPSDAT